MNEESISSKAKDIKYEKLIKENETEYEEILRFQQSTEKIKKIAKECLSNLEENILKNYSLLKSIDKVSSFKDGKIFDSKTFVEIFEKFKKDFLDFKEKSNKDNKDNKEESKNLNALPQSEQIQKRLDFLKFLIKIHGELNQYNILTEILKDKTFLDDNQRKLYMKQFLNEFKEKREYLFNKEGIKFYIFLILEFNYLENKLEYRVIKIDIDKFKYKIKLKEELKNIQYLNEFIRSFSCQKDKEVIGEMAKFIFDFYNSTQNCNILFKKCNDEFLNESYLKNSNIIDLFKFVINNLEKNYVLKERTLSSLSRKAIFKLTIALKDEKKDLKKDLYFFGNTRINEIIYFLNNNNNFKDYKNNDDEYFMIEYKNDKDNKNSKVNISLDEFSFNKTLNELKKEKLEIIRKRIITRDELLDNKGNLTEKFKEILIKFFAKFSKEKKEEMNRTEISKCINALLGYKEQIYGENSIKVLAFLKSNSKSLDNITQEEFLIYYKKSSMNKEKKEKIDDVLSNIRNMDDLITERPQEIEHNKLPRYYLSNKIDEFEDSYLWKSIIGNFTYTLNEYIFDLMSFLSVNEEMYNNVLNNFNKKENMKLTKKNNKYIEKLYHLYIIESIIEDVEILNNKDNINDNNENKENKESQEQKEKIRYENIYQQNLKPFDESNNEKINFFIDFIKNNYSDLVIYASSFLEKLNTEKEENDNNNENNNITILSCIKCLDIINIIYNCYHNIK